ncbi:MAG TPA: PP2C family protein-serine/threonine phosphatase [Vicinamibacteria bacterium]
MYQPKNATRWTALLHVLWQIPVYSLPFGIFFGTIFGASLRDYYGTYVVSLVFTSVIMVSLWAVRSFVVPALERRLLDWRRSFLNEGLLYLATSLLGSFVAALILHATLIPGFLGGARRVAVLAMFSLLFAGLLTAVGLVLQYHKSSIEHARREQEMELARRIQHSFLPEAFPEKTRFEVHAVNVAARGVSGDFYDVVPAGDALLLAVADVEGKSVAAALLTAMLQASLRTQMTWVTSAADIMSNINTLCCRREGVQQFATFFLMRLTEDGRIVYSNAGHNPPLLMKGGTGRVLLERGGMMLGVMEGAPFQEETLTLGAHDRIVVYTDGITERANLAGEEFGPDRLAALTASLPPELSARDATERIFRALDAFSQGVEPGDDQTLMVLQMRGASAPALPR